MKHFNLNFIHSIFYQISWQQNKIFQQIIVRLIKNQAQIPANRLAQNIVNQICKSQNYNFSIQNKKMQHMDVLLSYTQSSDPQEIFELLDMLGQGAYGNVSKALHKQTGELYAIKILPATSVNEISVIKKQIAVLRQCNDEHIVKYYGSYLKDNNLWIVMEYCMAGSITDIVNITEKELNQTEIASILELVLKGLKYLHDRKKIHRDIKAANILLDQHGTAKLADFGVSTEMMYTNARHNTHIGSPYWMSPEVIKYSEYNQKTDIWSLGVTAIQLAEGVVPYSHLKPFMAMWTMKDKPTQSFKQPEKWSSQFNDFIKQCLQINPDLRPEAQELLHHDFIKKNSQGKRILAQLVQNSMAQIQNFRAKQGNNDEESFDRSDLHQNIFNKRDSNGSQYETKTVIVKRRQTDKKSQHSDSIIERQSNSKSFKKSESFLSYQKPNKTQDYNDQEAECSSVIFKDEPQKGHSRNCSVVSVSSVLDKNHVGQVISGGSNQQSSYLNSYIQNLQHMHSKQQEFKQTIQQKITQIQNNFIKTLQLEYNKTKKQLKQFLSEDQRRKLPGNDKEQKQPQFQSNLLVSSSMLQYLYNTPQYSTQRQKLQQDFKQKYLSSIPLVQNNFMSTLESGNQNQDNSRKNNSVLKIMVGEERNLFNKQSLEFYQNDHNQRQNTQQYRKKSQSSADSPTSLFNNRKNNIKKYIIQETLEERGDDFYAQAEQKDTQSADVDSSNSKSIQMNSQKQSTIGRFGEKTPINSQNNANNKYKDILISSESFNTTGLGNKRLLMSQTNYGNSNMSGLRGQKRVITTQPHQAYDYDNHSVSTSTKHGQRNIKQFYDDPVVMNNLKQLTQPSEQFNLSGLNPFELKKSSFSKEIKSVKSKEKQKEKIIIRQKQRATHIAHVAMAHNKERTVNNSNKKIRAVKTFQQRDQSPQENSQSIKPSKTKKSKSKNKQTASTTIPFGSVGNIGALDFLPGKIGKSKQKKVSQIPVKIGPFSKIKNRNS